MTRKTQGERIAVLEAQRIADRADHEREVKRLETKIDAMGVKLDKLLDLQKTGKGVILAITPIIGVVGWLLSEAVKWFLR